MDDTFEIVISFLLCIVIFFIFPIYLAYEKKDDLAYALCTKYVTDFVEEVKVKGYVSDNMYQTFKNNIVSTGNTFDIYMQHKAAKVYPDNKGGYVTKEELYTEKQILEVIERNPQDPSFKIYNTAKNTSILSEDKWATTIDLNLLPAISNVFYVESQKGTLVSIYKMNVGDEFTVRIKNNNVSIAASLFNSLTAGSAGVETTRIYINYGAVITSEKYWN